MHMNTVVVFLLLTLNKFLVPKGSFYTPRKHHIWYVFREYGKEKRENFIITSFIGKLKTHLSFKFIS